MKGYTYDKSLSEKESQILSLVYLGNTHYLNVFSFVHKFYRINYLLHKSNPLAVFKTVYIEKSKLPAWKLASSCNLAQSTLFRLRNEIPECFYACLRDEQNTLKEIAVTIDWYYERRRNDYLSYTILFSIFKRTTLILSQRFYYRRNDRVRWNARNTQRRKKATRYGLDFVIEDKYKN